MARSLTVRPPTTQQLRRLHGYLETPLQPWQRRRAEALLLFAAGHTATFIAQLLEVHVNTIYADLSAFARQGLRCLQSVRRQGALPRLTSAQFKAIWRLAEQSPLRFGLPFGRWSLSKLRAYLIQQRLVKVISREHLRRVLKKGGSRCVGFAENFSATIHSGPRSCVASRVFGSTANVGAFWRSSTFSRSRSRPMAGDATRARHN